ncbi:MAG: hypothetical protein QF582_13875, partial [Alphaproteobacteria bacterium]|nr:hypothetical protein [Alphaproteobacteria bacterium]
HEEGIELLRQAIEREPRAPSNHLLLGACLAENGDLEAAADAIREQRRINEDLLLDYLDGNRLPFKDPGLAERFTAALRRATNAAA